MRRAWRFARNVVLVNDLRMRTRNRQLVALLTLSLAVPDLILIIFLVQHSRLIGAGSPHTGVQLFGTLAIVQLCLILLITPVSTASAVSGERHRRTWEVLLVTPLSGLEIVWGKLLAALAVNVLLVLAPLPLFASVFLFGGVTWGEMLRTALVLALTVLLLSAASLCISALTRRPTASARLSSALSLALGFGLSMAVISVQTGSQMVEVTNLGTLGMLPSSPPLTPLAQIDPLVALLSALPDGNGGTALGTLGTVDHAFGLPWRLPLWGTFAVLTLVVTTLLLIASALLIRSGAGGAEPGWTSSRLFLRSISRRFR